MRELHVLRHLRDLDEYRACVALQKEVWGADFSESVPPAILKVSQELGGVCAGAFQPDGALDGFVFGLTGLDVDGDPLHWSDMLAVRTSVAGQGLATRLKAFQRDALLARGVRRMVWTFDPLRARNAHLNLNKLGAVVREYRPEMYGDTDSDLHRGIGTDRFVALWQMDTPRVVQRLTSAAGREVVPAAYAPRARPDTPEVLALDAEVSAGVAVPGPPLTELTACRIGVAVPADLDAVLRNDLSAAVAWRAATRTVFTHYLGAGWEATGIARGRSGGDPTTAVAYYVLERTQEES